MTKPVKDFIRGFERKFHSSLEPITSHYPEAECTKYAEVLRPKKKYSDWDVRFVFKRKKISTKVILEAEVFIRNLSRFSEVGRFLSFDKKHRALLQHIDKATWIQFMAFMPREKRAPFFDVHFEGTTKRILRKIYSHSSSDEMTAWAMLTCWRKMNNKDYRDARSILRRYVLPSYPRSWRNRIAAHPVRFFKKELAEGYPRSVHFLGVK